MRIAAKGQEETGGKPAGCKPGDGDMQLEEITGDVETDSNREGSGPTLASLATRTNGANGSDGPAQCEPSEAEEA